ncbi:GIY-YIG nuclease family protein [Echinicola marina]|uniref:GIY-YIG nuclease family protein n=1 Tax=Echinicola marina TaxID=2859768 RepID=UPI001CF6D556|nr:GIY-YIG nuclease family protein [Echinicola marina]UCS94633.1 GIY-YIG nuclease family protein [Echinicola marina]
MYIVYAISSEVRNYIYVGLTSDLENRFHRHNSGYERTTKPYRPFRLIYKKHFETRLEARDHEKYLKGTSGKRFLRENYL